ncbi:phosphoenolpyruvate--protein phosphotransferase [Gulosibacter molinativorax]|uniref:Phosphoenolpyruvate-protein phosphotransferase n=1 Tax=Gulosibacter molinativorax TaxID=256821 RepID=A0ABT7CC54_9MICO|nr:phosphoenolpyruvate--protein phosphotransferase [Gulosibacter molinativorax]MDJ1372770.1 phosphoenolpyruvate--protein phosphotransferase [Gulosibacter molinativorax]QUY63575.1 Phosphoenolpyruvate-protein phosphotransferase [Gulosibacter molinativorax]
MNLSGFGVGTRVAIGEAVRMPAPLPEPRDTPFTGDVDAEQARAGASISTVQADLAARASTAEGSVKEVLDAQSMMAADPSIAQMVNDAIVNRKTAERAVFESFASYAETLKSLGGYMAERATDLNDISQRIRADLSGVPVPEVPVRDEPFILVAVDLAPADTSKLDLDKVLAFVTRDGSPKAHTGIIAAEKGLPAVVAVAGADDIAEGQTLIVDAGQGLVVVDPTEADIAVARAEQQRQAEIESAPLEPGALADGTPVALLANVGKPADAQVALDHGAEGVGLFRTEFLFLDRDEAPSAEQQVADYTALLAPFAGKKVVARVLDAGADKPLSFLNDAEEANPALGMRGIRILREKEPLLRTQLEALRDAQAATGAELWVMAPMVADAADSEYFTGIARSVGLPVVGSMVELPSAAVVAEQVLRSSDFVSIGTNDLTQYALGADRVLGTVANYQDPWHPAVLRLISMVGAAGQQTGKPVGVCGEAAADPRLAVVLIGLGVTSLSMAPPALAGVRASLKQYTLEQAREIAQRVLQTASAEEARAAFAA